MRAVWIVWWKELTEALRDRRTLWTSVITGPVLVPLLFVGGLALTLNHSQAKTEASVRVAVVGTGNATNLVQFLREAGLDVAVRDGSEAQARAWIRDGQERVVMLVPDGHAADFRAGRPARVLLLSDSADGTARRDTEQLRAALQSWAGSIAVLRLQARGLSSSVIQPLVVDDIDVATPSTRATLLLGLLSYLALLVMLMGGLYVAIDTTAGERERGSLESLLTMPVQRRFLLAGKLLATATIMTLALALLLVTLSVGMRLVPLEQMGMAADFSPAVIAAMFLALLPFVPFGAAGMMLIASFTRSYREAQTWLSVVLAVPTLPIAVAGVLSVRPTLSLMAVPSLSQHLLLQSLLRDEPLPITYWLTSFVGTLSAALLLAALTARLWQRETLLG